MSKKQRSASFHREFENQMDIWRTYVINKLLLYDMRWQTEEISFLPTSTLTEEADMKMKEVGYEDWLYVLLNKCCRTYGNAGNPPCSLLGIYSNRAISMFPFVDLKMEEKFAIMAANVSEEWEALYNGTFYIALRKYLHPKFLLFIARKPQQYKVSL